MKKYFTLLLFLILMSPSFADTTIKIPADFLSDLVKNVEMKTDMNFIKRLLINQIIQNVSINGAKLKDFTTKSLVEYFSENGVFKETGSNKLIEPNTGATLEFNSDGNCTSSDKCTILVDFNGEKGPNEIWTDFNIPKDRVIFKIQRNSDDSLNIIFSDFTQTAD